MESQKIKVRLSLGTKLLFSTVILLGLVISFLTVSTLYLFSDDKKAYIYESQSVEALLSGREFVTRSQHALDTLRILLGSVDPRVSHNESQKAMIQNVINNQSDILKVSFLLTQSVSGKSELYASAISQSLQKKELIPELQSPESKDVPISQEWMQALLPMLKKEGFSFLNLSQPGGAPLLGVLFADRRTLESPYGMTVAVGLLALNDFGAAAGNLRLSVATKEGRILFDSDPSILYGNQTLAENPLFIEAIQSQTVNGAREYHFQGVSFLGSYQLPGLDLVVLTQNKWDQAMKPAYILATQFILLGGLAIGLAIIFALFFAKSLTSPLLRLYDATKEVSQGNFHLQLEAKGRDEIAALSGSFNSMSQKIAELLEDTVKKTQLENELQIASTVQKTLIPQSELLTPQFNLFSHYQAASQCGGDWWGYFYTQNKLAFMIADATGHGLPSALMTASARSCFSVMEELAANDPHFSCSPSAMLRFANRVIYDASHGQMMMTFFVGVIDFEKMKLTYSSAGHNPPWLFQKNQSFKLKSLVAEGVRLGEVQLATEFEERSVEIGLGDLIFLYTDGLIEGRGQAVADGGQRDGQIDGGQVDSQVDGQMYGKKRAKQVLQDALPSGPKTMVTSTIEHFLQHNGEKPLDDDVTVVVIEVLRGEVLSGAGHPV